ncbi:MAG: type III-B CRISPR module-associated protein Cmr3 [Anaerolineae bacterium]|nr:type III-B CRISPR module-associated protein Cmr3 [Anaerolineae bacterium]
MISLFLEAVDVWLFRDGKPFDAKSDHRARSLFPPSPLVMQGGIRSHYLTVKGVNLSDPKAIADLVGTAEDYKGLRLRGPFVAKRENDRFVRYFPVPADAAPCDDGHLQAARPLRPDGSVLTNAPDDLLLLLWSPACEPTKKEFGQWLTEDDLRRCLKGEAVKAVRSSDLFTFEPRLGIARDDARRTTQEGMLYEVEFVRPTNGVGLWLDLEGYADWPASGVLRIGGEGRAARFEQVESIPWPQVPDPLPSSFKLYFATPTYFDQGWRPAAWSDFFDGDVQLVAAALNRYQTLGGYDWAAGAQKTARRYVPAGSVYYFRCNGSARLKPGLVQSAVTHYGAEIGFGQLIMTEWKE